MVHGTRRHPWWWAAAIGLVLVSSCFAGADEIIDQANDSEQPGGAVNITNAPIGQEFRPNLSRLDFVDLYIWSYDVPVAAPLEVDIRVDSWEGELLGTSFAAVVQPGAFQPVRLGFPETIDLTPGVRYVLDVRDVTGAQLFLGLTPDLYDWGRPYIDGMFSPLEDAWFREGFYSTGVGEIPDTWGGIKSLFR